MWMQDISAAMHALTPLLKNYLIKDIHLSPDGLIIVFEIDMPDTTRYFFHIRTHRIVRFIDSRYEVYKHGKFFRLMLDKPL